MRQATRLVGREAERAALLATLERDGPLTVFVHGPAGAGKSTLLDAFSDEARARGATVLGLDCRGVEPTERGFLGALGDALGGPIDALGDVGGQLRGHSGYPTIIVLDTYEVLRICDPWLRQAFAPALDDSVRLVLAGREPPVPSWLHAQAARRPFAASCSAR